MNSNSYTLKSVAELPPHFHPVFTFRYFNSLQSECFSTCYHSDVNMVISAPTGSGKTVLFELCIMRLLAKFISPDGNFIHHKGTLKTIYIAPSKALVQEKLRHWTQKFGHLGINCLELTGDNEYYNIKTIQDADIILTTPEKFDAVTRYRIKDGGLSFFSDIALLLIDEVHLLNDPRGAALEAIVSRIKMLARNPEMKSSSLSNIRFLAVSATIPNLNDIAEWLMVPAEGIKRFGEEMRPVKLTTKVFGYTPAKNDFLFEKRLQNYIYDLLMQHSGGKSALIFCSTRKGAQEAAQRLSHIAMTFGHSSPFIKSREQQERLREASLSCSDKQMQSYMVYGVGYHNGGLSMKDRSLIEGLFLNGDLQILCTTNTLAHGINLPAHTVVIKSTQYFNKEKGMYAEYERSMISQMCGRAGRPPFDDTGTVIIMTRKETVHLYENLLSGCELVESQLLPCITEHLTAEIVQSTVSDITMAIEWMECSYLFVRMKKARSFSPSEGQDIYFSFIRLHSESFHATTRIPRIIQSERSFLVTELRKNCKKVNELSQYQIVWTDEDGFLLKALEPGKLMTKYYLKFDTMKHIIQAATNCSIEDALHILCRAEEIAWIQLRRNEKKILNDINIDKDGRLRFHVQDDKGKRKKRIQTREEKIFILVNDCLTGDPIVHDLSMSQDMNSMCSNGSRIARCMKEYFMYKKSYKGALNSSLLAKCLHQKLWDDSPYLLKQLPGIGMVTAKALLSMGVKSFETLAEADPRRIEIVTGRKYPFGNHIKDSLLSLPPKVEMVLEETEGQKQGKSKLMITLTRISPPVQSPKRHYADMVVGIEEDNVILFNEKIRLEDFSSPYSATVLYQSPHVGKLTIKADLIFEDFIGIDLHQKVIVTPKIDLDAFHNYKQKEKLSFKCQPKDVVTINDKSGCTSAPTKEACTFEELIANSTIPSFNLMDEEFEIGENVMEIADDDDDCKIISERTVFDHIREKAKGLPVLPLANDMSSPSLETFALIRKRTRERHLELEKEIEVFEVQEGNETCPEFTESKQDRHVFVKNDLLDVAFYEDTEIWHGEGTKVVEPQNTESNLTEESVFEHIRKKSKNFPQANRLMTANNILFLNEEPSRNYTPAHGDSTDGSHGIVTLDPETTDTGRNVGFASKDGSTGLKRRTTQMPSLDSSLVRNDTRCIGSVSECNVKNLSSSSLVDRQCNSVAVEGTAKKVNSYLGFQSVFSFL